MHLTHLTYKTPKVNDTVHGEVVIVNPHEHMANWDLQLLAAAQHLKKALYCMHQSSEEQKSKFKAHFTECVLLLHHFNISLSPIRDHLHAYYALFLTR